MWESIDLLPTRRQLPFAMASPLFCVRHAGIFNRQMTMIIIEAEAQQLQPLPSSASIIIVLTVAENYFSKKRNALDYAVDLPLFIKILAKWRLNAA